MLHEQEEWLSVNRAEIGATIEEGYASAQRGELIDGDQVRAHMEEKKRARRDQRRVTSPSIIPNRPTASSQQSMRLAPFSTAGPVRRKARQELTNRPCASWTVQHYPNYIIVYDPATLPLRLLREPVE